VTLRRLRRAVALAVALMICILRYWLARLRGPMTLERRALWLQQATRGVLASLGITYTVEGEPPVCGLVVANHLSYLDILMISAAMPCFFVAKAEVERWPFFGKAARSGGTLFLDRGSLASANDVALRMRARLELPIPVLLFPEGTSSDGTEVLRFHSRLIHPATEMGAPITAAAIRYVAEGAQERELCWYGDENFVTHLWKVLGAQQFLAVLKFGRPRIYSDRRAAAKRTHDEVTAMREAVVLVGS
jgi:lyso-ornithine lipid O-acyltransferase